MAKRKPQLQTRINTILASYGSNIITKLNNVSGKTGRYEVPVELFQNRTARYNRVLFPWKILKENNFTLEELSCFSGGVVIEFVNNDFFDESNQNNQLFTELKNRLGSDDMISSMISIRNEFGNPSSTEAREAFNRLISNTEITYCGQNIIINEDNYRNFGIRKKEGRSGLKGNDIWEGFLYVSVRGGEKSVKLTHSSQKKRTNEDNEENVLNDRTLLPPQPLFNPVCEFATKPVCNEIKLVLSYFALLSIHNFDSPEEQENYNSVMNDLITKLTSISYPIDNYENLYDYCKKNITTSLEPNKLFDPIIVKEITIEHFDNTQRTNDSLDLTHNEAVQKKKYYWDDTRHCILSPARPTNVYWSFHLSNMMMQNFTLGEFLRAEHQNMLNRIELFERNGISIDQIP